MKRQRVDETFKLPRLVRRRDEALRLVADECSVGLLDLVSVASAAPDLGDGVIERTEVCRR